MIINGGPAFPISDMQALHRVGASAVEGVTDSAERDRLYIEATARASAGMTLRDYFASQTLNAHSMYEENGYSLGNPEHRALLARDCYAMADAMLAERAK